MNHTPDAAAAGHGDSFGPEQAAALLDQATQRARRQFEPAQPWLLVIRAVAVLGVLGAVWLVRGQHPYEHPTGAVIPFVIAFGVLNLIATVTVRRRAQAGVSGKSRLRPAEIAILAVIWIGAYAALGVMAGNVASDAFVYGLYPVSVPLIAAGLAWAAITAARADWVDCATGLAVAATGAIALAAGPAGAWAVAGIGLCVTLLGHAATIVWQQRRSVVGS